MRIYLFEGRHGFRPQDVFKFISVAPIIKDLFSDAKLPLYCEINVRFHVYFAFCRVTSLVSGYNGYLISSYSESILPLTIP